MTCVTCKAGNRHTTRHDQRESPAREPARQNRYTDPLHTASAERRHTLATQAINRGMRLEAIAALLGHQKMEMTLIYANSRELHQPRKKPQVSRSRQGPDSVPPLQAAAV